MHLVRLMDFTQRALCRGRLCYLVSYDVAGAFDNVSHTHLMRGLVEFGVDGENRRVIRNWLRLRTFQVRLRLPTGLWYSSIPPISKGLPQGRVLPPLLWLIFFNAVPRKVELARQVADGVEINYRDLLYADDATSHTAADRREVAVEAARKNARVLRETLMEKGLRLNDAKTNALTIDPVYLPGETFQRAPRLRSLATTARMRDLLLREERMAQMLEQRGESGVHEVNDIVRDGGG